MKRNNQKRGFTIIELVIVIAVIAILAAVLIPTFSGVVDKAKESKALQEVSNAYKATLANDLSTADTSDDVVYDKGKIVVQYSDKIWVEISENGEAKIVNSGTATHELKTDNGEQVLAVIQNNSSEGND